MHPSRLVNVPQGVSIKVLGPQSDGSSARVFKTKARLLPTGTDFRKEDAKATAADKAGDPQGRLAQSGTVTDWSTGREACAKVAGLSKRIVREDDPDEAN